MVYLSHARATYPPHPIWVHVPVEAVDTHFASRCGQIIGHDQDLVDH